MTSGKRKTKKRRVVGVREAARLLGCSPWHAACVRKGTRQSARLERRMLELGIKFNPTEE